METENPKKYGYTDQDLSSSETRFRALFYLVSNYDKWPSSINTGEISDIKFGGFRFIRSSADNMIYFADCIVRGISEREFLQAKIDFKEVIKL